MAVFDRVQSSVVQGDLSNVDFDFSATGLTSGNTIVMFLFHRSADTASSIVISEPGTAARGTWTLALDEPHDLPSGGNRRLLACWVGTVDDWQAEAAGDVIRLNLSAEHRVVGIAFEVEGALEVDDNGGLVVSSDDSGDTQVSSLSTGTTAATTAAATLVFGAMGIRHGSPGTLSWTNSLTQEANGATTSGGQANRAFMEVAAAVRSSTGTQESTPSWSTAEEASAGILALKEADGAATPHALAGSVDAAASAAGDLVVRRVLAGQVDAVAALSGDLVARRALIGSVDAVAAVSGAMLRTRNLAGSVDAQSALSGDLVLRRVLAGQVDAAATLSGNLGIVGAVIHSLSGTVAASSDLTADLVIRRVLAGQVDAAAALTGDLVIRRVLVGTIEAAAVLNGGMQRRVFLVGSIDALATLIGDLSGPKVDHPVGPVYTVLRSPRFATTRLRSPTRGF